MDLVLHPGGVDHQPGVVANHHPADVHFTCYPIDIHIGHPGRPGRAEARPLAVHITCIRKALAVQPVAAGALLLRLRVHLPTRTLRGGGHQFGGTPVVVAAAQLRQPEGHRVGAGGKRQFVDITLVGKRIGQCRNAAQPTGAQQRRHVVDGDAHVLAGVRRARAAVAHLEGLRDGFDRPGQQQRQRRRTVARVAGLEIPGGNGACGIQPAPDLHPLRGAFGLPDVFLFARQLHAHRCADSARQQRRIGRHVVGAVAAVTTGGFHADHIDGGVGQAGQPRQIGAQHMRVLCPGPDGEAVCAPIGQRT